MILVLAVGCLTTRYVLCYCCGYYQKSFVLIFWQEILAFVGLVLIFIALIAWIVSLFQRKNRLATMALLLGLFSFWSLKYIVPWPHDLIRHGMRDGMLRNYSLDEMRGFARDFDQLPKLPQHDLDGRTKLYWNRRTDDDLPKTKLKDKYHFLANCEAVFECDNMVHVDYGGFENHWGFSVAVNGKRTDSQHPEPSNKIIRVSDDIFFTSDY